MALVPCQVMRFDRLVVVSNGQFCRNCPVNCIKSKKYTLLTSWPPFQKGKQSCFRRRLFEKGKQFCFQSRLGSSNLCRSLLEVSLVFCRHQSRLDFSLVVSRDEPGF